MAPATIGAGGTATVTLTAKDGNGNQETGGGCAAVAFALGSGTATGTFGPVTDHNNGTYTATFTGSTVGTGAITCTDRRPAGYLDPCLGYHHAGQPQRHDPRRGNPPRSCGRRQRERLNMRSMSVT